MSEDNKKINKIMFHLNSLGKGGAERVVSLLAGMFAEDGVETVIATEWNEKEEYVLHEKVKRIHVGLTEGEEMASRLAKQWFRIRNLRKAIISEKPDLVISFCVKANYRAMIATRGLHIPVVASVRNDPKIDYVGTKNQIMNKLFLNRADGCVFQTEEAKVFFDRVLQNKSAIISNPIEEKFLSAERKEPQKKIVNVGRLVEQKNQMLLIKAFEKLLKKHPDYQLALYGAGDEDDYKKELLEYIEKKGEGLKEAVHFMGLSSSLEEEIADAAMFVLSSDYEGMPNALMEAMAMGLPVISTDCPCGGSRYWITHKETGQLTAVDDVDQLTESMVFYIENTEMARQIGLNARERMKEATLDKIYLQWKNYLEKLFTGQ